MLKMHIQVNTTSLHVCECYGTGWQSRPTLILLHYFGGSGRSWDPVTDLLATQGWACLAPDLRGFGDSPAPGKDPVFYAVDAMADDIYELAAKLGLPSYIVVGHSMGGKVALALAAKQPAGLVGVALLAPSPPSPEPMEAAERSRLLDGYGDPEAAKKTLGKITAHPLPKKLFDTAVADGLRASAPAWRAWLERGSREDISSRLAGVEVPIGIAVGWEDKSITGCLVEREIRGRLNRAATSLDFLRDVGHLLPLEAPEATVAFLTGAFASFQTISASPSTPLAYGT